MFVEKYIVIEINWYMDLSIVICQPILRYQKLFVSPKRRWQQENIGFLKQMC